MLLRFKQSRTFLSAFALIWLISGCGLKGPLYQSQKKQPVQTINKGSSINIANEQTKLMEP